MRREAQVERVDGRPSRGTARRRRRSAVFVACAVAVSSCGGAEESVPAADEPEQDQATEPADEPTDEPADADEVPVPVARFVAAGPGEPNTFGPMCATEIDGRGDDMFRITVPEDWSWRGRSGGSGPDEVDFETPFGEVTIEFFRSADELSGFGPTIVVGDGVAGSITLGGEEFPLVEMTAGDRPALGLTGVPYLGPLPITGTHEATVVMSAVEPIDPAVAASILSTVRAERCGVVEEAGIWGPAGGVHLVTRFDPDPLGKPYPAGDQPRVAPGEFGIANLSLDQLSYLLSFEAPLSDCLAPLLVEAAEADPVVNTMMISPANAPADLVDELIVRCS